MVPQRYFCIFDSSWSSNSCITTFSSLSLIYATAVRRFSFDVQITSASSCNSLVISRCGCVIPHLACVHMQKIRKCDRLGDCLRLCLLLSFSSALDDRSFICCHLISSAPSKLKWQAACCWEWWSLAERTFSFFQILYIYIFMFCSHCVM